MPSHLLGHDLAPVGGGWRRLARAHQPEVGCVEIGADEEFVADMVGLIDEAAPARLDDPEFPGRLIDGQVAEFAPSLGVEVEEDEFARFGKIERNAEGLIALLVDQHVVARGAADAMPPDLVGAQGLRLVAHIEERAVVGGEHDAGGRALDTLIDDVPARDRAHEDAKFAVAAEIDGEGDTRVVGADGPGAEVALLGMARGQHADVEHDLLFGPAHRAAPHDERVLRALAEAALIEVAVDERRYARIRVRRTRLQFRSQLVHQRLDRFETRVGIGVLRRKIGDHARIVAVAEPIVFVDPLAAERRERRPQRRRHGRCEQRRLGLSRHRGRPSPGERSRRETSKTGREFSSRGNPVHVCHPLSPPQHRER